MATIPTSRLVPLSAALTCLMIGLATALLADPPVSPPSTAPASAPSTQPAKELTLDLGDKVTLKLVLIPAGKFTMGAPASEYSPYKNDGPQHEVTISHPFYMGIYPVTQQQYEHIMGNNRSMFKDPDNPMESVNWDEAAEFCKKVSQKTGKTVHLPTEAQWEYACRAGTTTQFSYGDDDKHYSKLADYAWYKSNSDKKSHPVGQKEPNDWGLYDMHGDEWQWCADWYSDYTDANAVDPQGPDTGTKRVVRGGCWYAEPARCRSAFRMSIPPNNRHNDIGFRIIMDAD